MKQAAMSVGLAAAAVLLIRRLGISVEKKREKDDESVDHPVCFEHWIESHAASAKAAGKPIAVVVGAASGLGFAIAGKS